MRKFIITIEPVEVCVGVENPTKEDLYNAYLCTEIIPDFEFMGVMYDTQKEVRNVFERIIKKLPLVVKYDGCTAKFMYASWTDYEVNEYGKVVDCIGEYGDYYIPDLQEYKQ